MDRKYEIDLLVRVARMYYLEGLKQDEIAKKAGVSRSLISLILAEARQLGIVEVTIRDPRRNNESLARELEKLFSLKEVHVVPTSLRDDDLRLELTVRRGIEVLNAQVKRGFRIGISWGLTVYTLMSLYQTGRSVPGLEIVPLVGATNRSLKRYDMNGVVREFAEKVSGTATYIHAPAYPATERDYNLYFESSELQSVVGKWRNLDLALFSIGSSPTQYSDEIADSIERGERATAHLARLAVGDICARFFDSEGQFIDDDIASRTIAIPAETLATVPMRICIAAGDHKIASMAGGLRTGLVDVLVIDEPTAQGLLSYEGN